MPFSFPLYPRNVITRHGGYHFLRITLLYGKENETFIYLLTLLYDKVTHTMKKVFYTQNGSTGAKYNAVTAQMDITDIAKAIRKDLKEKFPAMKFSVTTDRFSMGCSLTITIKQMSYNPFNPAYDPNSSPFGTRRYTKEFEALLEELEKVADQYNYSDCDGRIDYFDVNYYSHVKLDCDLSERFYKEIRR